MKFYFVLLSTLFVLSSDILFSQTTKVPYFIKQYIMDKIKYENCNINSEIESERQIFHSDVNSDGLEDIVTLVCLSANSQILINGVKNIFYISIFLKNENTYNFITEQRILSYTNKSGYLNDIEIDYLDNNLIYVTGIWWNHKDANCCPTLRNQLVLTFSDGQIQSDFNFSLKRLLFYNKDETVNIDNCEYSIKKVEFKQEIVTGISKLEADGTFLLVSITIFNKNDKAITLSTPNFKVLNGENVEYDLSEDAISHLIFLFPDKTFYTKKFPPNISKTILLAFEVPKNFDKYYLKIQNDNGFDTEYIALY